MRLRVNRYWMPAFSPALSLLLFMRVIKKFVLLFPLAFGIASAQTFPPKYHTYSEAIGELEALVFDHPDICSLDSIGYSNRDSVTMFLFKVSDNVQIEEDEPAVFFNGGVHADEVLGVEVVVNFCDDIVAKYVSGDTEIQRYVDSYEIFVIPFINPEGHLVVEGGDLTWRKNKSDNDGNGIFDFHDGVDNNRNFDFAWNIDVAPDAIVPESLQYKGPYPYSESENRCLRDIGIKYKPLIAVDYHSPTYGRFEVVYYNWYWYPSNGGHGFAPDEVSMRNIGTGFAGSIIDDQGDSTYEARRALVDKGDFKTYYYANFGTAAFVCEISDTTIQDTSLVDSICQRHLAGMYYLLRRAGYARLTGVVTDSLTGLPLQAEVTVQQATSPDINPRYTRPNSGRYDRLIDPGTYTLIFSKAGYASKTISGVVVTNSGPTVTNARLAQLSPPPDTPILISPPDGSVYDDSLALNFDWGDAGNATGYIIEIAIDSGFASYFEFDSTLTQSNYRNTSFLHPGLFFWRVTASNASGHSARSQVWRFTILGNLPPDPPMLIEPEDGFLSDSAFLTFDWNDPSTANRYQILVDDDIAFASPLISDSNLLASQYQNADSLANGDYYWKVRARNEFGWSDYSQARSFGVNVDTGIVYVVGDVNHNGILNGVDVVYFVNYLKGVGPPPPLEINGFYPEADANGNCLVNGVDVVYLVNYFKGGLPPIDGHCVR